MSLSVSERGYLLRWDGRRDVNICAQPQLLQQGGPSPSYAAAPQRVPPTKKLRADLLPQSPFPRTATLNSSLQSNKLLFLLEFFRDGETSRCPPTSAGQTCSNGTQNPSCAVARCAPLLQDLKVMRPEGPRALKVGGLGASSHIAGFTSLILLRFRFFFFCC